MMPLLIVCALCVSLVSLVPPLSGSLCWLIIKISLVFRPLKKNRPSAGVVTASDWASVITAMTSQISVSTVVGVLATLVTAGIGLVFLWWGVRKAVGSLMGSFRSGRIRL